MKRLEDKIKEAERMEDVLLLVKNLIDREEITVKMIIDCLYEVGSINLIDRKISHRSLNKIMKTTAKNSKPLFRAIAIVWFKKNCPKLITTWLHSQVTFDKIQKAKEINYVQKNSPVDPPETSYPNNSREIKQLRSQVRLLASTSAVAIVAFVGSMMMWLNSDAGVNLMPTSQSPNKTLPENAKVFK